MTPPSGRRILVTGGAGYIGSVLVTEALRGGYAVRVLDNLRWGGQALLGHLNNPRFEFQHGDIRNRRDLHVALEGIESVVHLAAIVGDPACRAEPDLAKETNLDASLRLLDQSKASGVRRFLFASTCSNYGRMASREAFLDENAPLSPISLYAELKVAFEKYFLADRKELCATALRFSTAYGISTRMRFDLTVNEFTREAVLERNLEVFGEQFWRPYCHTTDLARACLFILEQPEEKVCGEAFNVGDDEENYQKQMLVEELKRLFPRLRYRFIHKEEDPRDYRVTFRKIRGLGFRITRRVPDGIGEIATAIRSGLIRDPDDKNYTNTLR